MMCPVCNKDGLALFYKGKIRKGRFPNYIEEAQIYRCQYCEVQMYDGNKINYETEEYRELVDSGSSSSEYYANHDHEQSSRLSFLDLAHYRGGTFVDVGAGAGSFLDLVKGFAKKTVAVEPALQYHEELSRKSHEVFSYSEDAIRHFEGKADVVTCFSVIEHIDDPQKFVKELSVLCKPGGSIIISTPNVDDWLIEFLPLTYKPFFYRIVHKWYFNSSSLKALCLRAGLKHVEFKYKQRFNLTNALNWIKEGKPTGNVSSFFSNIFEILYEEEVESKGKSDYIYIIAKKENNV